MRIAGKLALVLIGLSTFALGQAPDLPAALEQLLAPQVKPNQISLTAQVKSFVVPGSQGTATIIAHRDGSGSVSNTFGSEITGRALGVGQAQSNCTFTDKKGIHPMAGHNCLQDQIWEVPYFLVSSGRGPATYDGKNTLHFSPAGKQSFHAGYDLLLASDGTLISSKFAAHPDNDDQVDLQTEYRYSDWRPESGVLLPHTVEKYVNGSLALRYQVQTVSVN